jgi:hypothetical protein
VAKFLTLIFAIAAAAMTGLFLHQRSKTVAANERLDQVHILCRVAQTKLAYAAKMIRANDPTKAAEIAQVHFESIALDICPTPPFDMTAWMICRDAGDDACMVRLLVDITRNIDRSTQRRSP